MRLVPAGLATTAALACAVVVPPAASGRALVFRHGDADRHPRLRVEDTGRGDGPDPPSSETVIRFLDSQADITTRYGGGFVQSINGLAGTRVTATGSSTSTASSPRLAPPTCRCKGGDRIWWDYRNWTAAMSVPAVVGSWPEPFAQASADHPKPVAVECLGRPRRPARRPRIGSRAAGVKAPVESGAQDGSASGPRVLVGPWTRVRDGPGG